MPETEEPTVQMLWDIEQIKQIKQIKQLKARYFRFLDTKEWRALATLFTEDCRHMPEITLLEPRDAEGIWAMFDYVDLEGPSVAPLELKATATTTRPTVKVTTVGGRISSNRNVRPRVDTPTTLEEG